MRTFIASALAALLCVTIAAPASAARIYNFLAVPIRLQGPWNNSETIAPGQKSPSISWGTSNLVAVFVTERNLSICDFNFGDHAEITGGHYMIVSSEGIYVTCTLCDSDGKVMQKSGGRAPSEIWDAIRPRPSTTKTC
jgi:hypothetical protein